MITQISILLIAIFLFLSGIHIYWAYGGVWGSEAVIPTKNNNVKVMAPGLIATLIVAFGLLVFSLVVFLNLMSTEYKMPGWLYSINKVGLWAIAGIFILRAIGDFNYVGFFKKTRNTAFGKNDTKYYSPLCFVIGVLSIILVLEK
jgi:hypothetical protein